MGSPAGVDRTRVQREPAAVARRRSAGRARGCAASAAAAAGIAGSINTAYHGYTATWQPKQPPSRPAAGCEVRKWKAEKQAACCDGESSMVDYSKWDALDVSSDEDETSRARPRVTRFDQPSRVTLGDATAPVSSATNTSAPAASTALAQPTKERPPKPSQSMVGTTNYAKWDNLVVSDSDEDGEDDYQEFDEQEELVTPGAAAQLGPRPGLGFHPAKGGEKLRAAAHEWARSGGSSAPADTSAAVPEAQPEGSLVLDRSQREQLCRNGGDTGRYLWSQTKDECVVAARIPAGARAKDVVVEVDANGEALRVGYLKEWVIEGKLDRTVVPPGEPEDIEWEIIDEIAQGNDECAFGASAVAGPQHDAANVGRLVLVTLKKSQPHGVVTWWKTVLAGDPEIDPVRDIPDRKADNGAMAAAWAQAHEEFRKRTAAHKPIEIE
eukprot:SAG31_NODE_2367_length_5855_cov_2.719597_4_plen_439_part_00